MYLLPKHLSGRGSLHCARQLGQSGTNSQTCQTLYDFTGGHTLIKIQGVEV